MSDQVRTFKPRRRPLSSARAALYERLAPAWCLAERGDALTPHEVFGRHAPVVLEIGIGHGEALTTMALAEPGTDVIGVDVHTPGIAASLARLEQLGLMNVRLVHGDALVFLGRLPVGALAAIRLYFPDPWPKARHRHRRMATAERVERLATALGPGGSIHLATDVADYAAQMQRVCAARGDLVGGVVERPPDRPVTRYERRGIAAGRSVIDLRYRRS